MILSLYRFQTLIPPSHQLGSRLQSAQLISGGTTEGWAGRPLLSCTVYQGTWWTHDEFAKWMEMAICNQEKHHLLHILHPCSMVFHDFPTPATKHGCLEELLSDVSKRNPGRCQHWVVEASANQWIHSICGIWCWEVMRYYMMERDRERERERGKKRERERERERERDQPWHVWHAITSNVWVRMGT